MAYGDGNNDFHLYLGLYSSKEYVYLRRWMEGTLLDTTSTWITNKIPVKNASNEHRLSINLANRFAELSSCSIGWLRFHNNCYMFTHQAVDYYSAYNYCRTFGSYLVSIIDEMELNFIKEHVQKKTFWTSLNNYNFNKKILVWEDGEISKNVYWMQHSEPNKCCSVGKTVFFQYQFDADTDIEGLRDNGYDQPAVAVCNWRNRILEAIDNLGAFVMLKME
uniref:C-type lectin domain-containing protein n=1 Tax=Syphacia muris TaxID=451379 RepID=A0A0N5ASQ2_9BILA